MRVRAVQAAIEALRKLRGGRTALLRELARLDPAEEKALAEEWLDAEVPWPEA